ncbi:MAG: dTMP kinase [Planctomycetota bacterium]
MSVFVVLDGVDGSGKSTQAERLVAALARRAAEAGRPAPVHLREPGTTPVGERVRALLLDPDLEIGAHAEVLLFAAARRESLTRVIAPALAAGRDVVCDRFHPSTFAYQGVAGDVGEERVLALLAEWAGAPAPDVEVVLDVDPCAAAGRRGRARDRIEAKGLAFQERVAEGYRRYVARTPRAVLIDGAADIDTVEARIQAALAGLFEADEVRHGR